MLKKNGMERILIEVDTPEDEELLLALLPRLNSRVVGEAIQKGEDQKSPVDILKRIAAGGSWRIFCDASEWQREIRSWDRVLYGRQ